MTCHQVWCDQQLQAVLKISPLRHHKWACPPRRVTDRWETFTTVHLVGWWTVPSSTHLGGHAHLWCQKRQNFKTPVTANHTHTWCHVMGPLRERVLSLRDRVLPLRDRVLSLRDRVLSLRDRVLSLRDRVLFKVTFSATWDGRGVEIFSWFQSAYAALDATKSYTLHR